MNRTMNSHRNYNNADMFHLQTLIPVLVLLSWMLRKPEITGTSVARVSSSARATGSALLSSVAVTQRHGTQRHACAFRSYLLRSKKPKHWPAPPGCTPDTQSLNPRVDLIQAQNPFCGKLSVNTLTLRTCEHPETPVPSTTPLDYCYISVGVLCFAIFVPLYITAIITTLDYLEFDCLVTHFITPAFNCTMLCSTYNYTGVSSLLVKWAADFYCHSSI